MHVDRQRFVLLASAIAAGCGGGETIPAEIPVATPRELEGGVDEEPAAEIPAEPVAPLTPSGSSEALSTQLAERCKALREPSGPFCEGFDDTAALCPKFADVLEPSAARQAVSCLTERSGTMAICGYQAAESCFLSGLGAGAAMSESARRCQEIVSGCQRSRWRRGDLTKTSCQQAFGAVRSDKLDDLVACMNEGCGLQRCVYDLID